MTRSLRAKQQACQWLDAQHEMRRETHCDEACASAVRALAVRA
jgi:hypothetical protein